MDDKNNKNDDTEKKAGDKDLAKSDIPEEVIEKLPSPAKEFVRQQMSMVMSGPAPHPLMSKIESEHITKIIDSTEKESQRAFQDSQSSRKWNFAWLVFIGLFIFSVFCLFIFADKAEYIVPIGTAMLGFAGGFGIGHYKRKN